MQLALDVAGFAGPVGSFADAVNAGISLLRGDIVGAGVNAVAIVPIVGDTVKGAKMVGKGVANLGNLKTMSPWALKEAGINAHVFKAEHVGPRNVSKYNIYKDPSTGELVLVPLRGGPPHFTGVFIK